jgi:ribosomal-protein-alanine N-acetyltransferase
MRIILETPRLLFRQFTIADAGLLRSLNSDPEVTRYLHEAPLLSEEDGVRLITGVIEPQYAKGLGRLAIHLRQSHEFIGWCGLKQLTDGEVDLGYSPPPHGLG